MHTPAKHKVRTESRVFGSFGKGCWAQEPFSRAQLKWPVAYLLCDSGDWSLTTWHLAVNQSEKSQSGFDSHLSPQKVSARQLNRLLYVTDIAPAGCETSWVKILWVCSSMAERGSVKPLTVDRNHPDPPNLYGLWAGAQDCFASRLRRDRHPYGPPK